MHGHKLPKTTRLAIILRLCVNFSTVKRVNVTYARRDNIDKFPQLSVKTPAGNRSERFSADFRMESLTTAYCFDTNITACRDESSICSHRLLVPILLPPRAVFVAVAIVGLVFCMSMGDGLRHG